MLVPSRILPRPRRSRTILSFQVTLARPDGRRLVAVQLAYALVYGMMSFLAPWALLTAGAGVGIAAAVTAAGMIPYVIGALPSGLVADRGHRRAALAAVFALAAVTLAVVAAVAVRGGAGLVVGVVIGLGVLGLGRVLVEAVLFAALPAVTGRRRLVAGQATTATALVLGLTGGPALAAVLVAASGVPLALAAGALILIAGAYATRGLTRADATPRRASAGVHLGDAVRLLSRHANVRTLMLGGVGWGVALGAQTALITPLIKAELGVGAVGAALILAAGALAALAATPLAAALDRRLGDLVVAPLLIGCFGVPLAILALAPLPAASALAYGAAILIQTAGVATMIGARARRTPARMQGLVGVLGRMLINAGLVAGALLGALGAARWGFAATYLIAGAWTALVGAVVAWRLSRQRRDPARHAGDDDFPPRTPPQRPRPPQWRVAHSRSHRARR